MPIDYEDESIRLADENQDRKWLAFAVVTALSTILLITRVVTSEQWVGLMPWVFGIAAGAEAGGKFATIKK